MALPANIGTGTVVGFYIDSFGALAEGTVTFTPSPIRVLDPTATPPTTMLPRPVTVSLTEGAFTTTLVATDDTDLNPTGWTYEVTFNLRFGGGSQVFQPSFSISLPEGSTVDLTTVTPVPDANGVATVVGPGVPDGGTTGQVLAKTSSDDYDTHWITGGGGGGSTAWADVTGKPAVIAAGADAATARAAIGAGTSSLTIGTTVSTAMAGNKTAADLGGATAAQGAKADTAVQPAGLTKAAVGLGSVDNTADTAKVVAPAAKPPTARPIAGKSFDGSANITLAAADVGAATTAQGAKADTALQPGGALALTSLTGTLQDVTVTSDGSDESAWPNRFSFWYKTDAGATPRRTGSFNEFGEARFAPAKGNTVPLRAFTRELSSGPAHTVNVIEVMDDRTNRNILFGVGNLGEIVSASGATFGAAVTAPNIGNKVTSGTTAPASPSTGDVWIDTSA